MNWENAKLLLVDRKLIKLPEWIGFWYCDRNGDLKAFTAAGKIEEPYIGKYKDRLDWEETDGYRSIGGALMAILGEDTISKNVIRMGEVIVNTLSLGHDHEGKEIITCTMPNGDVIPWNPTGDDLTKKDYLVFNDRILNR